MITILIVDDTKTILVYSQMIIGRLGHTSITANNGEDAVEVVRNKNPDLILMDIQLPVMDGIQACQIIKSEKNVPLIMLTSKKISEYGRQAVEAGCDGYLAKPLKEEDLISLIKKFNLAC